MYLTMLSEDGEENSSYTPLNSAKMIHKRKSCGNILATKNQIAHIRWRIRIIKTLSTISPIQNCLILEQIEAAVESLFALWDNGKVPSCLDILRNIRISGLFETGDLVGDLLLDTYSGDDLKVISLRKALEVPFDELLRYAAYVSDQTRFATHQGVKGLEFPRVMVVLDDSEARGFLFSYEKLFGAKEKSPTDLKNEKDGKDTSIRRTARLFYVACTRAIDSLAVVTYSEKPELVRNTALSNGWFLPNEIVMI